LRENFCLEQKPSAFHYFGSNAKDIAMFELTLSAVDIPLEAHSHSEIDILDSLNDEGVVVFVDDCDRDQARALKKFIDKRSRKQVCAVFAVFQPAHGKKEYEGLLANSSLVVFPDAARSGKGVSLYGLASEKSGREKEEFKDRAKEIFAYRLPTRFEQPGKPKVIQTATDTPVPPPWSSDLYAEAFVIIVDDKWFSSRHGFPLIVFSK
jgi:hypothetical protein